MMILFVNQLRTISMMNPLLVILLAATAVSALTERERKEAHNAMYNPELFEGDILGIDPGDRNIRPERHMRWPDAKVPYVIDSSLAAQTKKIEDAMEEYHTRTCVRFIRRTTEKNYIKIFKGQGCYSYVGLMLRGEQLLSLGRGCHFRGTIIHELGHALGFYHEQSRSDRDQHLTIYWENIEKGQENQFKKLREDENLIYNVFDYNSNMIYGNYAFSKDAFSFKTMVAKNGQTLLEPYDKPQMTESDVFRVKRMYNC